jgi:coenzyme F420 hydrogenase subunit beta
MEPDRYRMVDDLRFGRRPIRLEDSSSQGLAMQVCPGHSLGHETAVEGEALSDSALPAWGPVLGVWEGHASDPEIRFAGSSGGAATALALFSLERQGLHGVLHIDKDPDRPYLNQTVLSSCRPQGRDTPRPAPANGSTS